MATMDVFNNNAFSMTSLVDAVEKVPFKPRLLGDLGIFVDKPIRTDVAWVESRNGTLTLIPVTPRGAPLPQRKTEQRGGTPFKTVRVAKGDRIYATELVSIRQFGSETELMQVQAEVMRRLTGPTGLMNDWDYTMENLRLGAVQGIVLDADGSTVLQNWFTAFGGTQPAEIALDLTGARAYNTATAVGALKQYVNQQIVRPILRAAGAFEVQGIMALCGDNAYDDLTNHGEVRTTYLNQQEASELRKGIAAATRPGQAMFDSFDWGGVTWINYRGSDDTSMGINTDKIKFFPVGPGLFEMAWAPVESINDVGSLGRPVTPMIVPDPTVRQQYADIEVYSYPLPICTRPETLLRARRGA